MRPAEDDGLRLRSLARLGVHAPLLAQAALESGVVEVEPDVLAWEGSLGTVRAHRVVLLLDPELHAEVIATPSVVDALTAAVASAVAEAAGNALAKLDIVVGEPGRKAATAYRGRL